MIEGRASRIGILADEQKLALDPDEEKFLEGRFIHAGRFRSERTNRTRQEAL